MARNIHQSRRLKNRKPATISKPAVEASAVLVAATIQSPAKPAGPKPVQQIDAITLAHLPSELRRIAFFTAFVFVLLIVLWFFVK